MHILSIIFYLLACILLASLHWQKLAVASLHVWNGSSLYLWQNFIGRQFLRLLKMFVFWEPVDRGTLLTSGAGWSRHIAYIGRRRRHSADTLALCHTCFSDMSFNAAGRKLWNSLPTQLHQPDVELSLYDYSRHFCFAAVALCHYHCYDWHPGSRCG